MGWLILLVGMRTNTAPSWNKPPPDGINRMVISELRSQCYHRAGHANAKEQENSVEKLLFFLPLLFSKFRTVEPSESCVCFSGFKHCFLCYLIIWRCKSCIQNIDTLLTILFMCGEFKILNSTSFRSKLSSLPQVMNETV